MTRSGGDFQPRPLKRLFTMSRYKNRPCRERNHRSGGKSRKAHVA
uniref:Mobile element protein n=1 Tax=Escherichia coli TaxID=562 RepID=A0A7U1E3D1_ECOLX|nr:Mobile element protein [Escherichia coli]